MTILLANWEVIIVAVMLIIAVILKVKQFLQKPSEKKQELIIMWLIEAVAIAEKKYGGKTGIIKLSHVYSMFIEKYGFLSTFITKEVFENLVEKALRIMEETLQNKLAK